jgi:hypothetical protein
MTEAPWISVKEAAAIYGLNADYFRRNLCNRGGDLDRLHGLRIKPGKRRKITISRAALQRLIDQERGNAS